MPYSDLFFVNYHGEQQLELKAKADYTESAWLGWFKVSFYKVAYLGKFKEYNPSSFNLPAESLYASYIENGSWDVYQKSFIASANKTVNHLPLHIKFVYPSNYPEKFDTNPLFNTGVQLFDGQKLDQYFYESYSINVGEVGRWPTSGIAKINLKKYLDENYGWIFGEVVDYQKNIIDLDKWNATESLTGIYKYNVTDDSTVLGGKDFFWIIYFTILQSTSMNCTLSVHIKRETATRK